MAQLLLIQPGEEIGLIFGRIASLAQVVGAALFLDPGITLRQLK